MFQFGKTRTVKEISKSKENDVINTIFGFTIKKANEENKERARISLSTSLLDAIDLRVCGNESKTFTYANLQKGISETLFCRYLDDASKNEAIKINKKGVGFNKDLIEELFAEIESVLNINCDEITVELSSEFITNEDLGVKMYKIALVNGVNMKHENIINVDSENLHSKEVPLYPKY